MKANPQKINRETSVGLNTGYEMSQSGLSHTSKIALNTSTPSALANDSGVLERKVLAPDEFPRVELSQTSPINPIHSK